MQKALYILDEQSMELIYREPEQRAIAERVEVLTPPFEAKDWSDNTNFLKDVEIIISGWGAPKLDSRFLDAAPRLKLFLYGSGSIRGLTTDDFWKKDIAICSAWAANAVAAAEFAFSQILFGLKGGWHLQSWYKNARSWDNMPYRKPGPGAYDSVVGLVSMGMIGRKTIEWLRQIDVQIIAYDPYVSQYEARQLGVDMVELDEIFQQSDVVSLHAPLLEKTAGMITEDLILSMKEGATLINTSRGKIIDEVGMISALTKRPDLIAILDVLSTEPPSQNDPLFDLPNVLMTPHIAGCIDQECRRMAKCMIDELDRWLAGEELQWRITEKNSLMLA